MIRRAAALCAAPCAALCAALLALAGCGHGALSARPDWVIRSRLVFLTADLSAVRPAPPFKSYRVWFPFVIGDFYGPPGTGDFVGASLHPDGTFEVDLNRSLRDLLISLEPTHFSLSFMRIAPADARIARLAPATLQANGIDRIGRTDWVDMDSRERLMLVYVDRPARITGHTVAHGTPIVCDLRFPAAGYAWIRVRTSEEHGISYSVVSRPKHLALAVTPPWD
jgi:hypothetical protein